MYIYISLFSPIINSKKGCLPEDSNSYHSGERKTLCSLSHWIQEPAWLFSSLKSLQIFALPHPPLFTHPHPRTMIVLDINRGLWMSATGARAIFHEE